MANQSFSKVTIDEMQVPPQASRTRDEIVQETRQRRISEPAAAPMETDAEAGGAGESIHAGRHPAGDFAKAAPEARGPGDMAGQHRPRKVASVPEQPRANPKGYRNFLWAAIAVVIVGVIVSLI